MALGPEEDPAPRTFSWHELTTSDLEAAVRFYEQLFGLVKQGEFDMGKMGVYHMFGRERFTYGGMMTKPPEAPGTYWLHYIQVDDTADAAANRATALGATAVVPPMEVPGGDGSPFSPIHRARISPCTPRARNSRLVPLAFERKSANNCS